jgi:hypothetical protein
VKVLDRSLGDFMSAPFLICVFLFIVFAPCLVAFGCGLEDGESPGEVYLDKWRFPLRRGAQAAPLQAMLPEQELSKDFEIRSFPKGISQRRIVVRDTEAGVKLTIGQVRAAAVELIKLGGIAAAHEFALVAAASAAAMTAVKDAVAVAAREVLGSARNAYLRLNWGGATTDPSGRRTAWDMSPPPIELELPPPGMAGRWREAAQAA